MFFLLRWKKGSLKKISLAKVWGDSRTSKPSNAKIAFFSPLKDKGLDPDSYRAGKGGFTVLGWSQVPRKIVLVVVDPRSQTNKTICFRKCHRKQICNLVALENGWLECNWFAFWPCLFSGAFDASFRKCNVNLNWVLLFWARYSHQDRIVYNFCSLLHIMHIAHIRAFSHHMYCTYRYIDTSASKAVHEETMGEYKQFIKTRNKKNIISFQIISSSQLISQPLPAFSHLPPVFFPV